MFDGKRATGPGAGVVKYDVLTALGLIGMQARPAAQTSMLRLIAAVTARYNWRADEITIGQLELARLWGVAERTAKREVRRLTATGLVFVRRPGIRGRVAAYRLNLPEVVRQSRPHWDRVGPDFIERMAALEPVESRMVRLDCGFEAEGQPTAVGSGTWRGVRDRLRAADAATFTNWYDQLSWLGQEAGEVRLRAASPFVGRYVETHLAPPLVAAIEAEFGSFDRLRIESSR